MDKAFTYPFRYTPSEEVVEASREIISRIAGDGFLHSLFADGKMLGVLVCREKTLFAFSGLAGGRAVVDGFVPPVFDYTDPKGYFRCREAEIAAAPEGESAAMSRELQDWLFGQYIVHNGRGESMSIGEIFALRGIVPPGGTGECAAPKLLEYAFKNGLTPLSMGEFWYGESPRGKVREQGRFYPSCTGKCGPLLSWMLQGVEVETNPLDAPFIEEDPKIMYSDADIVVVNKPSGMLSVPGKTAAPCLQTWLQQRFPDSEIHSCHRLDQDTSGVMVFARNMESKVNVEGQFAAREVKKTYRARLCAGKSAFNHAKKGTIALPLMPDYYNRPCQMVDFEEGKMAVTKYEVLQMLPDGEIDVRFFPQTGRTHQLRVHSAHPRGLGRPIKGDHLYGSADGGRLYLIAESLEFRHPRSAESMKFFVSFAE
ncbi:MAG: RluA family pseudouridine synthase [Bacteroidales bacterium]|nr:RluA family pseudouridine synthase [Bacteroidales bacterium]